MFSEAEDLLSSEFWGFFSGFYYFVLLLTGKIVLRFITTTTTSEPFPLNFCYTSIHYDFHIFSNTKASTATQLYTKKPWQNTSEKIKRPEKINHYVSLCYKYVGPSSQFLFIFFFVLISMVLCVSCATCCAGPC